MNSNDCLSFTNTGHASTAYKSTGKHLAHNKLRRQSTEFTKLWVERFKILSHKL